MSFQSRARALTVLVGLGVVTIIGAALATLLLLLGTPGSAGANPTCTDTYTGSGSWATAANWSTGLPGPTTYACIAPSAGTVTYSTASATTIETLVSIGSGSTLSVTNGALVFQDTAATPAMNAVTVAGGALYIEDAASITTLSVTSGSLDGIGAITAGSLSWTGGSIGYGNSGNEIGSITTTGTATINLSTLSTTSVLNYYSLVFDGPTAIDAPATDPGFQQSYSSLVFADTGAAPTIAEGEDISIYYPARDEVEPGVTLDVTGSSGDTTTIGAAFSNYGTVAVPAGGTLSLSGGGTSTGTYSLTGSGVLAVSGVTFEGAGTAVTGSSGTFEVNSSSIVSNVSVGTITENGTGTSYFYGTVNATTISTGSSSGLSPQEALVFDGPTVTSGTLDVYGASVSGTGNISAVTFNWDGGSIGANNVSAYPGNLTVTGTATIDLSTAASTSLEEYFALTLEGPTAIDASVTDPGFQMSDSSLTFADTTSAPTIAEGVSISNYYPANMLVSPGVTLDVTGASGGTTAIQSAFLNDGTVDVAAGGSLDLNGGGTSTGTFSLTGNGILGANDVVFDGSGTAVTGSSGTLQVNGSSISSNVSVGTITQYGTSTSDFYGTVNATTINSESNTGAAPQASIGFFGPTVTTQTLDIYGGNISGTADISAVTFNWDGGDLGNLNSGTELGTLTTTGTATIDLSTASNTSVASFFTLNLDGPTSVEAPATDPGFQLSQASMTFGDTTSAPTIAEGVTITDYYPGQVFVSPGVTLDVTGSSGATTTILPGFYNNGAVDVPAGGELSLAGGGTSTGTFALSGNGVLAVNGVSFTNPGTAVSGSSGIFDVNGSSIASNVSVGTVSENGTGTTDFYGTVNATTISTGASSGAAPQASIGFFGPTVTTQALDIYGGNISGTADISAVTFNWDGGDLGSLNSGIQLGTLTTTGTATIDLSTASNTSSAAYFNLNLDGPTTIEAPATDPGFQLSYASLIFGDATSSPSIPEGESISIYDPGTVIVSPGVTLDLSGSSGAQTTISADFDNNGTVSVPAGATLYLYGGGTSAGTYSLTGNAILAVNGVTFTGSGTGVTGSSGTFEVNSSSIASNVSVGTITDAGAGTTYFYGTVSATTVETGASSGASPQENLVFDGPGATTQTLDIYGGSISGTAPISAVTFNWDGGDIGNLNSGTELGSLTTTGTATIDLSTASGTSSASLFALNLDGPTSVEAPATDPGFQLSFASLTFGDTTSSPTIAEGETITSYDPGTVIVSPGVTLGLSGSSGAQTTFQVSVAFDNNGTVIVPAGATLYPYGGGTSAGTYSLTGNAILAVNGVTFTGSGTGVTGSSGTFEVNSSSIASNVSVGTITDAGAGTSYFYGTVSATTISTGTSSGASPQENLVFDGPTVTAQTLGIYGASVSGTAGISAVTFNWSAGNIGTYNPSGATGTLTTTGTATIDLSTASNASSAQDFTLNFDGPTAIEAPTTDPGFQLSASTIVFGDTTSKPTIASGVVISSYYSPTRVEIASGVTLDSPSSGTATIDPELVNYGTLLLPAGATLNVTQDGYTQFGGTTSLSTSSNLDVGTSYGLTLLGGTVGGSGTVTGNVRAVAGKVEGGTGTAAGTLTISGSLSLGEGATLASTLDGTSAGVTYSQVVAASASLAGTLQLALTTGYAPATGNAYTVLSTTSTPTGSFGQLTPVLLGTKDYAVALTASGAVVTVGSSPSIRFRLSSSSPSSATGVRVTFTMAISGANGDAGAVTFYDGTRRIGAGPVAVRNGSASITTASLGIGNHLITARYYTERQGKIIDAVGSTNHIVRHAGKPPAGERLDHARSPGNRTRSAPGLSK